MRSDPDHRHLKEADAPRDAGEDVMLNAGEGVSAAPLQHPAILPADLLRDDEIIILILRPSLLYIPLSALGSLMAIAIISLILALAAAKFSPVVAWSEASAFGLGVLLVFVRLTWQTLDWYNRIFVLTDQRVIRRMGVLRVSVFQARLKDVQHTSVFMRLRERFCGLGTIGFATSGSDIFDAMWVMIRQPFAVHKSVVDAIRRYGK